MSVILPVSCSQLQIAMFCLLIALHLYARAIGISKVGGPSISGWGFII